ncbi:hypothetical protein ABK040_008022 [Willaertia magna]
MASIPNSSNTNNSKVILIAGGASGIGKYSAIELSKMGHTIIVASRREDKLMETVNEITQLGGKACHIVCDMTKEEQVKNLMKRTFDLYGRIDIFINAAGVFVTEAKQLVPIGEISFEYWKYIMSANFDGVFLGCKYAIQEAMEKQEGGGSIINIASAAGLSYISKIGAYTISKHGAIDITKMFAKEYAIKKIKCNAICPGVYKSEMTDNLQDISKEAYDALIKFGTPMNRAGQISEIFSAIRYLCSDDASYVTGATIAVDGGVSTSSM